LKRDLREFLDKPKAETPDVAELEDEAEDEGPDLQAQLIDRLAMKAGVEDPAALVKLVRLICKSCMEPASVEE
jgi:hypothetical protein